jgi:CBS domain-containing protein
MLCKQLMKEELEYCTESDTVRDVARRMREVEVGFMPVIDRGGVPAGVITDRDIALRVCAEDRQASATRVGDIMTREVVACGPEDPLEKAEEIMSARRKSRIMVVDQRGVLVGVISLSDLADADEPHAVGTLRHVAQRELHA